MKSRTLVFLISSVVVIAALITGTVYMVSSERMVLRSPMINQQPSIITYMEGLVEVKSGNSSDAVWIPAEIGMKLREGDEVRTGPDGMADIRIYDDGMVRILKDTEIGLTDLTLRRQDIKISFGTLYAGFHLLFESQDLRFSTPNSVAAVRGTELVFHVGPAGTRIDALSGITEVSQADYPDRSILLATGQVTNVSRGQQPSAPVDMHPFALQQHRMVFNGINEDEVFLVSQDIRFEANSARILPESMDELDDVARKLTLRRVNILITGHTADVGANAGQVRLSKERADTIMSELVDRGIASRRLSTIGYGGSRPVADNGSAEGRAANRRVEFLVVE